MRPFRHLLDKLFGSCYMVGMHWTYNDGGRKAAGFKSAANDCVTRAIAIATGMPYREVYDAINRAAQSERRIGSDRSSARSGVHKPTSKRLLAALGWKWTPTMGIGTGCRVHLRDGELPPKGRLIVKLSRHLSAVIDGVVYDTYDPSRDGTRCVYGYWTAPDA